MRDALRNLARAKQPEHMGLAYDMWAPIVGMPKGDERDRLREDWLGQLQLKGLPDHYPEAYDTWERTLLSDGSAVAYGRLTSRLLVGHGNPSATEVGLTLHHTWGVPVIPGSALKGLLAHYIATVYGPIATDEQPDPAREDYRGVEWKGQRVTAKPGKVYEELFGSPAMAGRDDSVSGSVIFHDALVTPAKPKAQDWLYARDVLTPHQKDYYRTGGGTAQEPAWPNDYDSPVPVTFLTVRPGVEFFFALSGDREWANWAMALLKAALVDWGVGGKTVAGYGRFDLSASDARERERCETAKRWAAQEKQRREQRRRASQRAKVADASPAERWRVLVEDADDGAVLEWVRRVFEATEPGKRADPWELAPELAGGSYDPTTERRALAEAIREAGLPALWKRGQLHRGTTKVGPKKMRARARLVLEQCGAGGKA